jgi:hypothetical protein
MPSSLRFIRLSPSCGPYLDESNQKVRIVSIWHVGCGAGAYANAGGNTTRFPDFLSGVSTNITLDLGLVSSYYATVLIV